MAGKSTHVEIRLRGKDETASAWQSVAARARSFNAAAGAMAAKALLATGAAAAGLGVSAKSALDSLNQINDVAQKSGVSASWLQQMTGALGQAGVTLSADTLSNSVAKLQAAMVNAEKINLFKNLGIDITRLQGLAPEETFIRFLETVAACNDEQTRMLLLQRGLEEQGLALAPLLRQGPDAFRDSLRDVMAMIPAVSDSAVAVATNANNALALLGQSASAAWQQTVGDALTAIEAQHGPIENVIYSITAGFAYAAESVALTVTAIVGNFTKAWAAGIAELGRGIRAMLASLSPQATSLFDSVAGTVAVGAADITSAFWDETLLGRMTASDRDYNLLQYAGAGIALPFQGLYNLILGDESQAAKNVRKAVAESVAQDLYDPKSIVDAWERHTGSVMTDLQSRLQEARAKWDQWQTKKIEGVSAKPKLSAFAPPTIAQPELENLSEKIRTAVKTGTKEGLADGIEASSYEVVKAVFRAASAPLASPIAAAAAPAAEDPALAPSSDLRKLLAATERIDRRLQAIGLA